MAVQALSSQAAVAGYKAVLIGAAGLDKFLPMLTTAAGTIRPARVLVIGGGGETADGRHHLPTLGAGGFARRERAVIRDGRVAAQRQPVAERGEVWLVLASRVQDSSSLAFKTS